MAFNLTELVLAIGVPVVRSVGGWANYALKDKKVTKFEWKKLLATVLKTGVYGLLIYCGADGFGVNLSPVAAGSSGIILDMVLTVWKEKK